MPIASKNKQIFRTLNPLSLISQITNSPKKLSSCWNMAYLYDRRRSIPIDKKFAMTTKDFAETSDYTNIFHHVPSTMLLPNKILNHEHHQKAEVNISTLSHRMFEITSTI